MRPCIRKHCRGGRHTPNLIGVRIGRATVIKLGPPTNQRTKWIIRQGGMERAISAADIIGGYFKGKNLSFSNAFINGKTCPIYSAVSNHYRSIYKPPTLRHIKAYKNMPFYDEWNPSKDGSYAIGVKWIKDNLPRRRKGDHLHVIDRKIGFWPGNLAWIPKSKHKQEEMVNKLLLENKKLRDLLAKKK